MGPFPQVKVFVTPKEGCWVYQSGRPKTRGFLGSFLEGSHPLFKKSGEIDRLVKSYEPFGQINPRRKWAISKATFFQ